MLNCKVIFLTVENIKKKKLSNNPIGEVEQYYRNQILLTSHKRTHQSPYCSMHK